MALPYAPNSFDAVLIANALHVIPAPEEVLGEIRRILKPDRILFAPTFVHGQGIGSRLRISFLKRLGYRVYSRWSLDEFSVFISEHGFAARKTVLMEDKLAPLCYLEATKE